MGELVAGRPALKLQYQMSAPLDLVSGMALLYRAVPGSGLDPWLIKARRALAPKTQRDLDLLHGFSGRMLLYMEEPVWAFQPLQPERRGATIDELLAFLRELPADAYLDMVEDQRWIGRAKGVLMDNHDMTEAQAWRFLQTEAMNRRTKVHEIAAQVVSGDLAPSDAA